MKQIAMRSAQAAHTRPHSRMRRAPARSRFGIMGHLPAVLTLNLGLEL